MCQHDESFTFCVTDENGIEHEYETLLTFECETNGRSYILYTDHSTGEDGSICVFASRYDADEDEAQLLPIETEEEWAMIQSVLEEAQNSFENE